MRCGEGAAEAVKHYHMGADEKQRPGKPRARRPTQHPVDASVDGLCGSSEGLGTRRSSGEETAFAVGFECAAYIALGAPELIQWWVREHQQQRIASERDWGGYSDTDLVELRQTVLNTPERMARIFGGFVAQTGAFDDLLGRGDVGARRNHDDRTD